ncbi:TraB/GumN family protein [Agarivorans sp.]|uniref:TraB/GumN family protein n=1 Tax=Agarivorans sp. TaxID=1872412 RepID=UPI003D053507
MKPWMRRLSSLLLVLSSGQLAAEPSLWLATKNQQQLYLFGSIHIGSEQFYPLPDTFIQAFERSQRLVIETDVSSLSASDRKLLQKSTQQPTGRSLADDMGPDYQQKLAKISQQLGLSSSMFDNLQAWYVAIMLSQLQMQALGYQTELGVDLHFIDQAKHNNTPIYQLESFAEQLTTLKQLATIQTPLLEQTIDDFEHIPRVFEQLVSYWNEGQNQQLIALLKDDPMFQQDAEWLSEALLYRRNRHWINQLTQLDGTSFVVVGAMHLYGKKGLLNELTQLGYVIREVDPTHL